MGKQSKTLTVSTPEELYDEWVAEADDSEMNRSEWFRTRVAAGRRQIAELEPDKDTDPETSVRKNVLQELPDDDADAIPAEDLVEAVLAPLREEIYDLLDENPRITSSARHGGYYKE